MAKATLNSWHLLPQCFKKEESFIKITTSKKMTSHNLHTLLVFWSTTKPLLIDPPLPPLFSIRHKKVIVTFFLECKKINFKIPWPGYFCKLCYFFKALVFECHICLFQAKFLSCAIFVSCNFFAMVSRGAFFVECILSDTAVFVLL